jgi:nitrite reductase/ring-hydroxylating ferredoxin subunit
MTRPGTRPAIRHVVALAADVPEGQRKRVVIDGRAVVVLNIKGELFALSDTCPHRGASLSQGVLTGHVVSTTPGEYVYSRSGEILRCPWHGWEFDVRTGRSWCDPKRLRLTQHAVSVQPGTTVVEGPYKAETFPVRIEDAYIVIETPAGDAG